MDVEIYRAAKFDLDQDLLSRLINQDEYNEELRSLNQERQSEREVLISVPREKKQGFVFRPFYITGRKLLYQIKRRRCPDFCPPKRFKAANFKREYMCTLTIY